MNTNTIRIVLVDDHKLARESWSLLLSYDPRFEVIREFENGEDTVKEIGEVDHDILLVDINMQPMNGFEVTRRVLEENPRLKVIGISVNNQPSYANRMIALGAKGFITKGSPFEEVTHAIVEVHNDRHYVCNEIKNMTP
ncbi:MAG TPA: response regulator transcription factor [Chitinophagaceae bacterium]